MKAPLFAVAESISVDRFTSKLSIFNLIDEINTTSFPLVLPSVTMFAIIEKNTDEPNETKVKTKVVIGDSTVAESVMPLDFQGGQHMRSIQFISGLAILGPAVLKFSMEHSGITIAVWEVKVSQPGAAIEQAAPPAPGKTTTSEQPPPREVRRRKKKSGSSGDRVGGKPGSERRKHA